MDEEIQNTEYSCFTGRISRLINVLNGYYDDINSQISDNSQIGTIISILTIKHKNRNTDELKEIIKKELKERNIDESIIEEWIGHIDI